jgi:hypothetical protein
MESEMGRSADTEILAGKADVGTESKKPPYPPSWVDRVADWVRRLPIPAWSFYSVLALALVLLDAAANWSNRSYLASNSFLPYHLMSDLSPAVILAMIHYFDDWAGKALATFRPAMSIEDVDYEDLHYQLTTMPRLHTIIATLIGVAYGCIYLLFLYNSQIDQFRAFASPVASVFNVTVALLNYIVYSLIAYHTIHQMRMISKVYAKCVQIDLFHLSPLYAFATVAARVSIALAVMTYAWVYAFSVVGYIVGTLTLIVAIPLLFATFILPLLGIHRLLQEEKTRWQGENAVHLRAALNELHRRREADEYAQIDGVGKAIDSLMKEQTLLKEIPTWPWLPDTVRWVATAILAPVALALVTRVVQDFLGL